MSKVIDSFIFFNEIELLEIRLNYLNDHVDKFIIVEAAQTFSGKKKPFYFDLNKDKFKKFEEKIIHIKVDTLVYNSDDFFNSNKISEKIKKIILSHSHYNRKRLHWLLDSYHRECIHMGLNGLNENDIILLSDLDEIPSIKFINYVKNNISKADYFAAQQNEFKYFTNTFSNNNWIGTVASKYKFFKNNSINLIRIYAKDDNSKYHLVKNSGWHFTSLGPVDKITSKIKSWGHQEYNNYVILRFINIRINAGYDIFFRNERRLTLINLSDRNYFDHKIENLLLNHNQLTLDKFSTPSIFIEILMFFSRIYILGFKIYMKFRDKF